MRDMRFLPFSLGPVCLGRWHWARRGESGTGTGKKHRKGLLYVRCAGEMFEGYPRDSWKFCLTSRSSIGGSCRVEGRILLGFLYFKACLALSRSDVDCISRLSFQHRAFGLTSVIRMKKFSGSSSGVRAVCALIPGKIVEDLLASCHAGPSAGMRGGGAVARLRWILVERRFAHHSRGCRKLLPVLQNRIARLMTNYCCPAQGHQCECLVRQWPWAGAAARGREDRAKRASFAYSLGARGRLARFGEGRRCSRACHRKGAG